MTNTQRNTTVISSLLAIIIVSGYFITHRLKTQVDVLEKKNTELTEQIAKFDKLLSMKDKIENDYTELKLMLAQQSKVIAQIDSPAITYNYLLRVITWIGRNIDFDFSLSTNKVADSNWNEYILSGKSNFRDVSNFIKQLEFQRALLTLEEITIDTGAVTVTDTVAFSVVFRTHFSPDGTLLDIVQSKSVPDYLPKFVSFRARIYDVPPDTDVDPSLVRIDKAKLMGITESRVFLRDDRGIIHILSVGDRVAYGHLYSIQPAQEKVVFKLSQYGSTEDKTMYLEK